MERSLDAEAVAFHGKATPVEEMSDGVKAFTGIVTQLVAGNPNFILIDEPEAFLHPALAHKLGHEVARIATKTGKNAFISTHSAQYIMGSLQAGVPINIVRLTYSSGVATARHLPSETLLELMRDPILRSIGVLNALFYDFAIVTESDADRAFYQEINERLLEFKPEWGIPNCLFLNAQGKHTLRKIIGPLRQLGIPAAAIVDIDVLKDGGANWSSLLQSAGVPLPSIAPLGALRSNILKAFETLSINMKTEGGLSALPKTEAESAATLFKNLAEYGLFVVPNGELESWLKHLSAVGHGPPWLINMFTAMGSDPKDSKYVRPSSGDVWEFLSQTRTWMLKPDRLGIPD